jgi:hypothetical protein
VADRDGLACRVEPRLSFAIRLHLGAPRAAEGWAGGLVLVDASGVGCEKMGDRRAAVRGSTPETRR